MIATVSDIIKKAIKALAVLLELLAVSLIIYLIFESGNLYKSS